MNKSVITNIFSLIIVIIGYYANVSMLFAAGIFAFSGAITNWLAIYMLFEKVPLLYGSGVIPAHFNEFKIAIRNLMMTEFFTQNNINKFLSHDLKINENFDLSNIINNIDLEPSFESLTEVIANSSFGGMLSMFGGVEALQPLKQPFIEKMQQSLIKLSNDSKLQQIMHNHLQEKIINNGIQDKIKNIIDQRLNELTPKLVKEMIQKIIQKHLGWLVVWGGIFGGLIGVISDLANIMK
jgi:uncharacterized membrane protein YheB (UPF0754 family)